MPRVNRRWCQFTLRRMFLLTALVAVALTVYVHWPRLALEGYCPVMLTDAEQWVPGDAWRFAIHDGCLYRFAGQAERQRFLADPGRYAPVSSGYDVALLQDRGTAMAGKRKHGCWYRGKVYLFASEAALQRFWENPEQYVLEERLSPPDGSRAVVEPARE